MTRCRNCDNESHCGISLRREEQDWATYSVKKIEVCESCHCELCDDD